MFGSSLNKQSAQLVLISFLSLFLELAFIRFINSTVQVIAYFNNFLIISAFLGLGFGSYLVPRRFNLFWFLPLFFFLLVLELVILDRYGILADQAEQIFWVGVSVKQNLPAPLVVLLVFCSNFAFFIPLGYQLGLSLQQFENRLIAYSYDLLGSFLGVAGFTIVSWGRWQPWMWFVLASFLALLMLRRSWKFLVLSSVLFGAGIFLSTFPEEGTWSPYYKITLRSYEKDLGYSIRVDKLRIQDALNFSEALSGSQLAPWVPYYRLPYRLARPRKVLILGGGAGNDATIALEYEPEQIDVVEIDPVLLEMGKTIHPHRPYAEGKVRIFNDDARAFLRRNHDVYDLIVMNALDSHHQLPGLSTLRLESFIYTVEAFEDVKRHMDSRSVFVLHHGSSREWRNERLYWSLVEAFGSAPRLFTTEGSPFNSIAFTYGPVLPASPDVVEIDPSSFHAAKDRTLIATDDWPHLYLKERRVPLLYIQVLGMILLLTGAAFFRTLKSAARPSHLHLFLLGAGFMLLETRSITQIALLFGSTWIVNAIVIGSILAVIFFGNILILKNTDIQKGFAYAGLLLTLILGFILPLEIVLNFPFSIRLLLAAIWVGLPVFFASLVFSLSFRNVEQTAAAFGANLLGVVTGGILEYSSMIVGLNALYLLAAAIYFFAWLLDRQIVTRPVRLATPQSL